MTNELTEFYEHLNARDARKETHEVTPTTFNVNVSAARHHTTDIEHTIEETLRAFIGANTKVFVRQLNDTTLEVTINQTSAS